jgi:hypothetical protein
MKRSLYPLVSAAAILVFGISLAAAQTAPPPGAPGAGGPSPRMSPAPPVEKTVDGPVKKIDPASNTVQVGWLFGLLSTTLAVTEDTHIAVEGAKGSLTDIREGDRVKAAYEFRDGKNIAKSMEVKQGEPAGGTGGPGATPGPRTSPGQSPAGSGAPPSGAPKTP